MKFADLRLAEPIARAVAAEGYVTATPIQSKAIPPALEGRDVLGCAQTGTGKTAAFALPILQRLTQTPRPKCNAIPRPRCLILCPTRELATQIGESFAAYGRNLHLHHTVIFGGVNQRPQVQAIRRGADIVIATPGRLLDLMAQGHADLRSVSMLVLDEADRMLDMGFIHDIRRITAALPTERQTMLFSATMPPEIRQLADSLMKNPVEVQVAPPASTVDTVDQSVYFITRENKVALLAHLVQELPMTRTIVFTRTKHGADRVVRNLHKRGIRAEAIHSNKSQNARQRAIDSFRANKIAMLVATDIASRGLDIDGITHVVNYDLTHEPETYVHRIGRTARAGASGAAISFVDHDEVPNLRAIEKLIRRNIAVRKDHPQFAAAQVVQPKPVGAAHHAPQRAVHPAQGGGHAHRAPHAAGGHRPTHPQRSGHGPSRPAHAGPRPGHGGPSQRRRPAKSFGRKWGR